MKIEQFNFEVIPWIYAGKNGGEERALVISVIINGKRYTEKKVMPNQQPFETEIEYYARAAVESLNYFIKKLDTEEKTK